jgi:hypothetical protein
MMPSVEYSNAFRMDSATFFEYFLIVDLRCGGAFGAMQFPPLVDLLRRENWDLARNAIPL